MGSNEVIIDNCNVAECENLEQNNACNEYLDGCCEGHNCLYKQLQRAKVENEKLKADNKALKDALFKVKDTINNGCYPEFDWLVL